MNVCIQCSCVTQIALGDVATFVIIMSNLTAVSNVFIAVSSDSNCSFYMTLSIAVCHNRNQFLHLIILWLSWRQLWYVLD